LTDGAAGGAGAACSTEGGSSVAGCGGAGAETGIGSFSVIGCAGGDVTADGSSVNVVGTIDGCSGTGAINAAAGCTMGIGSMTDVGVCGSIVSFARAMISLSKAALFKIDDSHSCLKRSRSF
jgi:hypothetical protein